jgi:hypothetical protein
VVEAAVLGVVAVVRDWPEDAHEHVMEEDDMPMTLREALTVIAEHSAPDADALEVSVVDLVLSPAAFARVCGDLEMVPATMRLGERLIYEYAAFAQPNLTVRVRTPVRLASEAERRTHAA